MKDRIKNSKIASIFVFSLIVLTIITVPLFMIGAFDPHHETHEDGGSDEIDVTGLSGLLADAQKVVVSKNSGAIIGTRVELNFIEGSNITLTITDDAVNDEVDIQIDAIGGGNGAPVDATYVVFQADATLTQEKILGTQVIVDGLDASLPLAGVEGRLYWATDTKKFYRDNGSSWDFILSLNHALLSNLTTGDPHTQYQLKSEKGAINGYASLDGSGTVPLSEIPTTITRDTEWDSEAEMESAWGGANIIISAEIDSEAELEALLADASDVFTDNDVSVTLDVEWDTEGEVEAIWSANIIIETEIDTEAELEALLTDVADLLTGSSSIEDLADVTVMSPSDGQILTWNNSGGYWEAQDAPPPGTHASSHEDGGGDEISVAGLSGKLADAQDPDIGASDWGELSEFHNDNWTDGDTGAGISTCANRKIALSLPFGGTADKAKRSSVWFPDMDFDKNQRWVWLVYIAGSWSNNCNAAFVAGANGNLITGKHTIGFKIKDNCALYGYWVEEDTTTHELSLGMNVATSTGYVFDVVYTAGSKLEWFVDGVSKGSVVANLPSGCYQSYLIVEATAPAALHLGDLYVGKIGYDLAF